MSDDALREILLDLFRDLRAGDMSWEWAVDRAEARLSALTGAEAESKVDPLPDDPDDLCPCCGATKGVCGR